MRYVNWNLLERKRMRERERERERERKRKSVKKKIKSINHAFTCDKNARRIYFLKGMFANLLHFQECQRFHRFARTSFLWSAPWIWPFSSELTLASLLPYPLVLESALANSDSPSVRVSLGRRESLSLVQVQIYVMRLTCSLMDWRVSACQWEIESVRSKGPFFLLPHCGRRERESDSVSSLGGGWIY